MNVSRFKKSLSDPNLMFNEIDSDEEQKEQDNDKMNKFNPNHH